jgi:UDP-N-acetylmuramate dehydrogenase
VPLSPERSRPLAPLTTLGLGGPASHFVEVCERDTLLEALQFARARQLEVGILAGGSNLVIGDAGFAGLVLRMATQGLTLSQHDERVLLTAQAGECWDELVQRSVDEGLAGIECLTGIPGSAGATPIQNVGAYGQEVSDVIDAVEVVDRASGQISWLSASACRFGYRDSLFKREPGRFVVLAVRYVLRRGEPAVPRYGELSRALGTSPHGARPSLRDVQAAVRALRSAKGMLIEPGWPRSAGSFFMNPLVTQHDADRIANVAVATKRIARARDMPRFVAADGRYKLAAGWLIEQSGIAKGLTRGPVGISPRHALALVHHGGGTTRALMTLADEIRRQVDDTFGVTLQIEPVRWGA